MLKHLILINIKNKSNLYMILFHNVVQQKYYIVGRNTHEKNNFTHYRCWDWWNIKWTIQLWNQNSWTCITFIQSTVQTRKSRKNTSGIWTASSTVKIQRNMAGVILTIFLLQYFFYLYPHILLSLIYNLTILSSYYSLHQIHI